MKRTRLFFGVLGLGIMIGGFLMAKCSFSKQTVPVAEMPFQNGIFKISGVIQAVETTGPDHSQLLLMGEDGELRALSVSPKAVLAWDGKQIQVKDLQRGDVVDVEIEFNQTREAQVRRLSVVVRPTPDGEAINLQNDPDFF